MIETPTIDIVSYLNNPTTDTAGSGKLNADSSADFGKVFDNVSKNYQKEEPQTQKVSEKPASNVENNAEKNTKQTNNNVESNDNNNEKPVAKEQDNSEVKARENSENNSQETNKTGQTSQTVSSEEQKTEVAETTDNKTQEPVQQQPQEVQNEPEPIPVVTVDNKLLEQSQADVKEVLADDAAKQVVAKADSETEKVLPQIGQEVKDVKEEILTVETKVDSKPEESKDKPEIPVVQANDNLVDLLMQTQISSDQLQEQPTVEIPLEVQTEQVKAVVEASKNNAEGLITNVKDKNSLQPQVKVTVQAEQQIQNPQQPINEVQNNAPKVQQDNQLSQQIQIADVDIQAQEADTLIVSEVDTVVKTKQENKEPTDKNNLTQDILAKTNAKIINIESSGMSGSNADSSQTKQDTQDQIMRLSIEANSKKSNTERVVNVVSTASTPDLASVAADTNVQNNFAKTLDNVQAQTQTQTATQAHTTKELSQNEILSQINSKLTNFKDEGVTKVNIVLQPESLGKINLELVNSKEGLTAQITTNNAQVKEMLDKTIDTLKDNLSNQGLNVNNVTVKVEETQKQQTSDMFSFENQSEQNNQQQSGNANHTNQGQNAFDEEVDNVISANFEADGDITQEPAGLEPTTEKVVSLASSMGKVDYKV